MRFAPAIVAARGGIPLRQFKERPPTGISFIDPVNGVDANDGLTYAKRRKTISNGTGVARIIESSTPTDMGVMATWTDQGKLPASVAIVSSTNATPIKIRVSSGNYATLALAINDTVQTAGHTVNTNGNGVFKVGALDPVNFDITLFKANGNNSVGNGVGGATGTIQKMNSRVITLSAEVTKNIALCGNQGEKTNWTASANVTCTVLTAGAREGIECQQIATNASFAGGLLAYWATGALDLSAYQQVCFWFSQTAGTAVTAGQLSLLLCSDNVGTVVVNTIPLPAGLTSYVAVVIDNLAALGANINSVALSAGSALISRTFLLDNIFASKAPSAPDSLTLNSLMLKRVDPTTEMPWPIQSVNSTRIVIDHDTGGTILGGRGYHSIVSPGGGAETVPAIKREPYYLIVPTSSWVPVNGVTYSGGWDAASMTQQQGESWFTGFNSRSPTFCAVGNSKTLIFNRFGIVRYGSAYNPGAAGATSGITFGGGYILSSTDPFSSAANSFGNGIVLSATSIFWVGAGSCLLGLIDGRTTITYGYLYHISNQNPVGGVHVTPGLTAGKLISSNNSSGGVATGGLSVGVTQWDAVFNYNGGSGYLPAQGTQVDLIFANITAIGNTTDGFGLGASNQFRGKVRIGTLTVRDNTGNGFSDTSAAGSNVYPPIEIGTVNASGNGGATLASTPSANRINVRNFNSTDVSKTSGAATGNTGVITTGTRFYLDNYGGVAGDNRVYYGNTLVISSQTTVRYGSSGRAIKFTPTAAFNLGNPLTEPIYARAVKANRLVTITCKCQRDNPSGTAKITVRGGQVAGVTSDVSASASGDINAWETLTLSFTPTADGVIQVFPEVYGGTGANFNAYFDAFTCRQAH